MPHPAENAQFHPLRVIHFYLRHIGAAHRAPIEHGVRHGGYESALSAFRSPWTHDLTRRVWVGCPLGIAKVTYCPEQARGITPVILISRLTFVRDNGAE